MYQAALSRLAPTAPALICLEHPQQVAVAMRVADLFSLRRARFTATTTLLGYEGKEGVWVVAIVFRLASGRDPLHQGIVYLNPHRTHDTLCLRHLTTQEGLPFLFLSPRLAITVRKDGPWGIQQRQQARLLLARLDSVATEENVHSHTDLAFEAVKAEFERLYPLATLLSPSAQRHLPRSFSSRGAVLD